MNRKVPPPTTWPQVIRDACWLWLRIAAGERDAVQAEDGQTFLYAIDASIASLYAEPTRNVHHAQILGLLDRELLPDLAYVLGDLALRRAEGTTGLILLPGHDEEFVRVFRAVQKSRRDIVGNRAPEKLDTLLQRPVVTRDVQTFERRREKSNKQAADYIAGEFEILHGILQNKDFDLARWYDFIARASLVPVNNAELALPTPDRRDALERTEERWFNAIRGIGGRRRAALNIEYDAQALAMLGWVNQRLIENKDPRQVVLLTLDEAVQAAALKYPNMPGARFLRDPRQFVRELPSTIGRFLDLSSGADTDTYGLVDWLRVFLSPFAPGGKLDINLIRRLARTPLEDAGWRPYSKLFLHEHDRAGTRLSHAQEEWRRFVRLGVNRYAVGKMHADPRLREIANIVASDGAAGLRNALVEYVVKTTSDASVSSLVAGLYVALGRRPGRVHRDIATNRMPVALRSVSPQQREQYLQFITTAVETKDLDAVQPFFEFLEKYRVHLYYGVYFAVIGDWEATETLARAAHAFADARQQSSDPSEEGVPDVTGQEAAYLLAVSQRHRVEDYADFERAEQAWARANALFTPEGSDARLRVEHVALELMRSFARLLLGKEWRVHRPTMSLSQMIDELWSARLTINDGGDRLFSQIVSKQIFSNIIVVGMLDFLRSPEKSSSHLRHEFVFAVAALEELQSELSRSPGLAKAAQSRYVAILISFGHWMANNSGAQVARDLLKLVREAEKDKPEMPYDPARYRRLIELIEERVGQLEPQ